MNDFTKAALDACGEALARASDIIDAERALADDAAPIIAGCREKLISVGFDVPTFDAWLSRWREARQR